MPRRFWLPAVLSAALTLVAPAGALAADSATLDPPQIEHLTGLKGTLNAKEHVFKVSYPRKDLHVTAAGVSITPPFGTTCWAAFTPAGNGLMVMGDLVLTEDQVNPVMSAALDNGLEVTALHNHFFGDTPKVMFMHIGGMGEPARLAASVGKVFAAIRGTSGHPGTLPHVAISPQQTTLDPLRIEAILGRKGELANGVYKVTIGRSTRMAHGAGMPGMTPEGFEAGNAMGVNTWAAFMGSNERAVVDGDFAMYENEVQGVLKALRHAGINIVAIHNHMIGEQPRVIFLHYWGIGPTTSLAKGLKAALDQTTAMP